MSRFRFLVCLSIISSLLFTTVACSPKKRMSKQNSISQNTGDAIEAQEYPQERQQRIGGRTVRPHLIIYKTHTDFSQYVPITLDGSQRHVVSYPAPGDVYYKGRLALPTPIGEGYFIDYRGVTPNSVFTNFTYEEYAQLNEVSPSMLLQNIKEHSPFEVIYDCGVQENDVQAQGERCLREAFKGCRALPLPPRVFARPVK